MEAMIVRDTFDPSQPPSQVDLNQLDDRELAIWAEAGVMDAMDELLRRAVVIRSLRFNPNHDAQGKFTSGGGSGASSPSVKALAAPSSRDSLSPAGKAAVDAVMRQHGLTPELLERELDSALTPSVMADAKAWYPNANRFAAGLAQRYGVSVEQAAAVISATSPRTPWPRNQTLADRVLSRYGDYPSGMSDEDVAARIGGGFKANLAVAVALARGDSIESTLTGVKRRSFFNNIAHPGRTDSVTVDTWMAQAAVRAGTGLGVKSAAEQFVKANRTVTGGAGAGYVALADAVRAVAAKRGIPPDVVQSAYWIARAGGVKGNRPGD